MCVWLRRVDPGQQNSSFDFSERDVAYLAGEIENRDKGTLARIRTMAGIGPLIKLACGEREGFFVFRGKAWMPWLPRIRPWVELKGDWRLAWIDNETAASFVLVGPTSTLDLLLAFEWQSWQDCAFGFCASEFSHTELEVAADETNREIWRRLKVKALLGECVPLFWEGRFSVHAYYSEAPLKASNIGDTGVTLVDGLARLREADAFGEGEMPLTLFELDAPTTG